jgi:hypothetical protein
LASEKPAPQPMPDDEFAAELEAMSTDEGDGHDIPF